MMHFFSRGLMRCRVGGLRLADSPFSSPRLVRDEESKVAKSTFKIAQVTYSLPPPPFIETIFIEEIRFLII